ncbi:Thioredoxin reductase [Actinoplanes philippinensis]|uniref:Thioredoxin reductase n=1 Tax=Actinoplanes philippinensis TaxID=35752 RepID=A0A1I2M0U5_9ACTN|nr:NAD(P)/FAD-dependent oxidoreductase [Actinoplanes philippinensis]SFF83026.1 Thioredoxin reductase [Actinoplanes philippinensis]
MNGYDVAVVGGGAAGLSAALVLTRARRRVVVIDAGSPRNAPAAHLQGFLSRDGMPPADLLAAGRAEVKGYGGHLIAGTVRAVDPDGPAGFRVRTGDGGVLAARRVVVATGLRDEIPGIPGLAGRWGRDVLHCPYCHGYEVRDRPLGVLGGSPETVAHALLIRQWSDDVTFFSHGYESTPDERQRLAARGIRVVDGLVTRIITAGDRMAGIELDRASVVAPHALFVRPRLVPADGLLTALGAVVADQRTGRTSVPGVWAAGNAVDPRAQVITAAGQGSAAAIDLNADLVDADVRDALPFSAAQERRVAAILASRE